MADRDARCVVSTDIGTVQGFVRDGVRRWRAIPYARPPVGALRMRAPQPAAPWRGVRHCDEFAYCAPQDPRYTRVSLNRIQPMSEDCLNLNVVAPDSPHDEPLPVMFFVHGGGYLMGSSAIGIYDGAALARRGCVYVSANYRLGALGCVDLSSLSTEEYPIDSNLFLRDLVLALEWVRDNIVGFGGDPGNVTIFGESAGAHAAGGGDGRGRAHPVPLVIGNNADEGRLFARYLDHLPTNQSRIERMLADVEPVAWPRRP